MDENPSFVQLSSEPVTYQLSQTMTQKY